jgi:hypothetical protein
VVGGIPSHHHVHRPGDEQPEDHHDRLDAQVQALIASIRKRVREIDPAMPIGPGSSAAGGPLVGPGPPGVSMPFPVGLPIAGHGINGGGGCVPSQINNNCNPAPPPETVPEPGTVVLVFSGAAAVFARFRQKRY